MTHEEFMNGYGNYLEHKWVSSKDKAKAAEQKKREQEYNAQYYREHQEEILANRRKAQASESMRKYNRNFTPEEALADLNRRAGEPVYSDSQKYDYRQNLADKFEQLDLDIRNRRMAETGKAQGSNQSASELYKRQQRSLSRRSSSDTSASNAQAQAAKTRSRNLRTQRLNEAASNAQAQAAKTARQNRTLSRRSSSDTSASNAQAQAAKKRSSYQRSPEAALSRAISRTGTKVNNMVNTGKAAAQKVKDTVNSTSARIQRAKKSVSVILNKYFG